MRNHRHTYLLSLLLLSCLYSQLSFAQDGTGNYVYGMCTSSALAPVYKQDFGTAASPGTKARVPSGFITNYIYDNVGTDGHYIVTP